MNMFNYTVMFGSDPNYYTDFFAVEQQFDSIDKALNDAFCMVKLENLNDYATIRIYDSNDELAVKVQVNCDVL